MGKINWEKVKDRFEREMLVKLGGLPGHREVSKELKNFRNIISHELPETAPKALFRKLIKLLLSGEKADVRKIRKVYLKPELEREKQLLTQHKVELEKLRVSTKKWVKGSLSEDKLQKLWKAHKTWFVKYPFFEDNCLYIFA